MHIESYKNKLTIDQKILDKIKNRKTTKFSRFINNRRRGHQIHINRFEEDIESISVRPHRFSKKNQEGFM